jgi:hypothetical protein
LKIQEVTASEVIALQEALGRLAGSVQAALMIEEEEQGPKPVSSSYIVLHTGYQQLLLQGLKFCMQEAIEEAGRILMEYRMAKEAEKDPDAWKSRN